jgi:S1-C subfamily serine protease
MTTIHEPPSTAVPGQTPPYHTWPGEGGPAGPGGPAGYGYGGGGGGGRPTRRIPPLLVVATAAAVGLATFLGLRSAGLVTASPAPLTTAQITAKVSPGLVDVVSTLGYQQAAGAGTGLVLTSSGEVLTNNHVIDGATSISVTDIGNGRTYHASVVGYDQHHDVAVLQLHGASGLQTVDLGNSSSAATGQRVVALGNAGGKGGTPSVVTGKIVGTNASIGAADQLAGTVEQLHGLIHHNAAIQPGDSGGPLVNRYGQVIGIDTAGGQSQSGQTQGFAIPINQAVTIARQVEAGTASATVHLGPTGLMGVQIMQASEAAANGVPTGSGAAVAGVLPGSPAASAGLQAGDVIVSVNGQRVTSPEGLQSALEPHHPGDRITVGWTSQAGQAQSGTLTLTTGPAD